MNLEELRARLGPPSPPPSLDIGSGSSGLALERAVNGSHLEGPCGPCFAVDSFQGRTRSHGRYRFESLLSAATMRLPVVAGDLTAPEIDLAATAFIDTETTGLGYGVGTQVFVVGIGHVEGDAFRVRQFFLRHPGEEHAVLAAISAYLNRFSTLVSYNGRSFDWPLLENRFIYQRLWARPLTPAHVDLLYTARRLWKRRLESCSLVSVESAILGVRRSHEDVEGWMIPQLYFRYLRTGDAQPLRRVFYHNLQDILSLAMLALHAHHVLRDPWSGIVEHPIDYVSLGVIHDRLGDPDTAVRCLVRALESDLPRRLETETYLRLGLINKRRANWTEAVPLFGRVLERQGFERIACVELAKYHEHVARDHEAALRYTLRAIRSSDFAHFVRWPGTQRMELHHRHRRLRRKLSPQAA